MTEMNDPCMTTKSSQDPGKPCVFPFKDYEGDLHHSCQKLDFNLEYCMTIPEPTLVNDWGYCDASCSNQNMISGGEGDLTVEDQFWESRLYDLRSWEESYCFTYTPPKESSYGKSEGIGIFLKKINTQ